MALTPGTRLGVYEVTVQIGEGGMGQVWRARDTKLNRDVALKVLPDSFANDPDRLARFTREAQTLALLNHPNIAHIHGLEESGGVRALVMELVEGEDLSQRIARGAIPIDEALPIAKQIAEALEAAHEQGIIHRDLKPANIKVRRDGTVKVLDFGLAKAMDSGPSSADSPTLTARATQAGMILGTAAYMSPEQARGQSVDERADIWAFGCVLYEMLIGTRAFAGVTSVDLLTAVIHQEPDWRALPARTPALVRRLVQRCLRKNAHERVQHAGDLRIDLEDALTFETPALVSPPHVARRLPWGIVAALGALSLAASLVVLYGRSSPARPETAFQLTGSVPLTPASSVAISPDGRQIVIAPALESSDPVSTLWLRPADSIGGRALAGTAGAFLPFWSPDSRFIGFFANHKLRRVEIQTGNVETIAEAAVGRGAAWRSDGTILFAPTVRGPLMQVSASGGPVTSLTTLTKDQNDHRAPFLLPGEDSLLYYARGTPDVRGVYVARRDGTTIKRVMDADAPAVYAPTGHLLFVRETTLLAQPFDYKRLELTGPAVTLAESVTLNRGLSLATLAASPSGAIAYGVSTEDQWRFAWFDRQGKRAPVSGDGTSGGNPSLSPDGRTIAFNRVIGGMWDIWTLDLERGAVGKVTSDPPLDFAPVWAADGRHVVFQSPRQATGAPDLVMRAIDGSEPERVLLTTPFAKTPTDVSGDGRLLLFEQSSQATATDLWVMSLQGDANPQPIVRTPAVEREGQFSPDTKWLAYSSNETGRFEVFVQPYPGPGTRVAVSNAGGSQLRWNKDGTELFYVDAKGWLNSVRVGKRSTTAITLGPPSPLFPIAFSLSAPGPRAGYVVSRDGQRFLMNVPPEGGSTSTIAVILNWAGPR